MSTNFEAVMQAIIDAHPQPEVVTNHHSGEGSGPWTREVLEERLQAWADNWVGEEGERFTFEDTARKDGFAVWCPGQIGWPDGESHDDPYREVNESSIVYVEDGWPRFSCRHNHCGEGAAHGKKSWLNLQEYYDLERKFHTLGRREYDLNDSGLVWDSGEEPEAVVGVVKPVEVKPPRVAETEPEVPHPLVASTDEVKQIEAEQVLVGSTKGGALYGVWASQVVQQPLLWLWLDRIPLGKITLLTGMQDTGKTTMACDLTARVSTGRDWPDGRKNTLGPRKVMYASTEDDEADTLVPRLQAAGADLSQILILKGAIKPEVKKKRDGTEVVRRTKEKIRIDVDAKLLKRAVEENPEFKLVVLDPLISYLGDVDQNKDKEIRPLMDTLAKLCQLTGLTVVGLIHLSKRSDVNAIQKVQGASSLVGSARAVWGISRDCDDRTLCHLSLVKGNLAKQRTGMDFRFQSKDLPNGINASYLEWGAETEADAEDLMQKDRNKRYGKGEEEVSAVDKAMLFLKDKLKGGEQLAMDMYSWGEAEGITAASFKRAWRKAGIYIYKGRGGRSYWSLSAPAKLPAESEVMSADIDIS